MDWILESFHWISGALSIILGLGITRLLSSFVATFKSRFVATLDWLPMTWAGCIFLWQLQFWWAIMELPHLVKVWTPAYFALFVGLTVLLFLSAALILPFNELKPGESMTDSFERDGRWALAFLCAYFLLAFVADQMFWKTKADSLTGKQMILLVIFPIVCISSRRRRVQEGVTVLNVFLSLWTALDSSPASY